jgi:cell volume regulation protein A
MSESAFKDAMGAIVTFGALSVAMGTGGFSLTDSFFEFAKQTLVGLFAGALLGYLAALLIAHERWAFLKEYAPIVSIVAVPAGLASRMEALGRLGGHSGHYDPPPGGR